MLIKHNDLLEDTHVNNRFVEFNECAKQYGIKIIYWNDILIK